MVDENSLWGGAQLTPASLAFLSHGPPLLNATAAERERFELSAFGIHWEHLDEDISVEGLLAGQGDLTRTPIKVA
ncbi:MAG: DUF2442 domain-containing protein [Bilophila sp.]